MAWLKWPEDYMTIPFAPGVGKTIRVTVEGEASECCEKWRGVKLYAITDGSRFVAGTVSMHNEAKHCPECGRKL